MAPEDLTIKKTQLEQDLEEARVNLDGAEVKNIEDQLEALKQQSEQVAQSAEQAITTPANQEKQIADLDGNAEEVKNIPEVAAIDKEIQETEKATENKVAEKLGGANHEESKEEVPETPAPTVEKTETKIDEKKEDQIEKKSDEPSPFDQGLEAVEKSQEFIEFKQAVDQFKKISSTMQENLQKKNPAEKQKIADILNVHVDRIAEYFEIPNEITAKTTFQFAGGGEFKAVEVFKEMNEEELETLTQLSKEGMLDLSYKKRFKEVVDTINNASEKCVTLLRSTMDQAVAKKTETVA